MRDIELCVRVPALAYSASAQVRNACAEALALEVGACAEELAEYQVRRVTVENACCLTDRGIEHVFATLLRSVDLTGAYRVAYTAPEQLSTAMMTSLRNFRTDLYVLDVGSLEAAEFHELGRPYAMSAYDLVARMLDSYAMRDWCAVVEMGMASQTRRTLDESLTRLLAMGPGPGAVRVRMRDVSPQAAQGVGMLLEHLADRLAEAGYARTGTFDFAQTGFEAAAEAHASAPCETWGIGPGAISVMEGCVLTGETDAARYLDRAREGKSCTPTCRRMDAREMLLRDMRHGLLRPEGVDAHALAQAHGEPARAALRALVDKGISQAGTDGHVRLTPTGVASWRRLPQLMEA